MAKKENTKLVTPQLVIKAPNRQSADVGAWRNALRSADGGRVKSLYDLFDDLLIDGVLSDAVEKRVQAVTNSAVTFQDADGAEVPEMAAIIDTEAFEELEKTILETLFWGRSGGEFAFSETGFTFTAINPKHIKPENKNILITEGDETGIPYEEDDHLLILGKPRRFGLLLKAAPYVIWKRGGFGDYAQWLELFGMPQRVGKYSSYDPESRKLLEQALEAAGSAPWIVVPKETDVETTSNSGGGSGDSYDGFRRACNEEVLITILGQTLTTTQNDTGARSLGEVHKQVEEGKNRADMRFVQRVLNQYVVPLLEKRGYPVTGGKFVFPEAATELTVADIVQLSDILDIPASFLHDKFSIPVPDDGEPIARRAAQPVVMPVPADENEEEQGKGDPVKNSDRGFWWRMMRFFVGAPQGGAFKPETLTLSDSLDDRIIAAAVNGDKFLPDLFCWISTDLVRALDSKPIKNADLGFTYGYQNDVFRTAQELNVFHFSAAKTLAELQELNRIYRESSSFDDFRKKAAEVTRTYNEVWQKTEWQTGTLISESTANYNRLAGKKKLFPYWQYKTVGDDKVRPEHRMIDDVVLPADDPRWKKIWPPNGWKCRCYVVPKMRHEVTEAMVTESRRRADAFLESAEWKKAAAQGFGVNRALMPEIYAEDQQYISKFPQQASRLLGDVNYQTYGLGSYADNRKKAVLDMPVYSGTTANFVKSLVTEAGKTFMTDYVGRKVLLPAKVSKEMTPAIQAASEALKMPDEVWINGDAKNGFSELVSLKYYRDATVAVTSVVRGGRIYQVKSWSVVNEKEKGKKKALRWGLLIKNVKR